LAEHEVTLEYDLTPVQFGDIALPHLRVTWEREKAIVVDSRLRTVFVF
jgi:hypothetical protein